MAPKIAVIYYSTYGHTVKLAETIKDELKAQGVDASLFQVPEILSEDDLKALGAPGKADYPTIDPNSLTEYDGYVFGFPTRYGGVPAAFKAFLDHTGALWFKGALAGKFAGAFISTGTSHGGQETSIMTLVPWLAHHGIVFVPPGFAPELFDYTKTVGGSAWGSGIVAGADGSKAVSEEEISVAKKQAQGFAKFAKELGAGRAPQAAKGEPKKEEPKKEQPKKEPSKKEQPKKKGLFSFLKK